ncbi:RNA-binding (RRM/RBD/RNP motifs) family protein [Trifolium repens]|nr:RNA-binding (RRM/RBD/RNP motifs) family protein [Trifolium repens]
MVGESLLLSQPSLVYTKTKCSIISNSIKPFKLQNPSSCSNNNSSSFSPTLPLTTGKRRTGNSSFLTFAVDESGDIEKDPYENLDVFIGNLPSNIGFETVFNLAKKVGTVVGVVINYVPGQSSYARVIMKTVEEVEKAMKKFNRYELNGKYLTVSREKPIRQKPKPEPKYRIYGSNYGIRVENLPRDVDRGRLEEIFSKHGKVESVNILVYDEEEVDQLSTGYLRMADETDIHNVIASLDGQEIDVTSVFPQAYHK